MLDFNNVSFEFLTESYNTSRIIMIVIGFVLLFVGIYIALKCYNGDLEHNFMSIVLPCVFFGFCLPVIINLSYCKAMVEVNPTKKITVEEMQKNNSFIEKDGKMYFVKTFRKSAIGIGSYVEDKSYIKKEIQKDFDKIISKKWIKENTIK